MELKVNNVIGDGNCFFRCLWNIAVNFLELADELMIYDRDDEKEGAEEIRYYISLSIRSEEFSQNIIKNLVNLYQKIPALVENYPVLGYINVNAGWNVIIDDVAKAIENTTVMASGLETEIIAKMLLALDIKMIILSKTHGLDHIDKWYTFLKSQLQKIDTQYIIVIVNIDNIHYNYMTIDDQYVISKAHLTNILQRINIHE